MHRHAHGHATDSADLETFLRDGPIGRAGRPEEIAAAVLSLCSPGAGSIHGVTLPADGGFVAH